MKKINTLQARNRWFPSTPNASILILCGLGNELRKNNERKRLSLYLGGKAKSKSEEEIGEVLWMTDDVP